LLLGGCVHTTEAYVVKEAPPEQTVAAASDAAQRLGLDVQDATIHRALRDDLGVAQDVKLSSPRPGTLEITSDTPRGLGATGQAIAAGTTQLLEGAPPPAVHITPRSLPLGVALSLALPFAGALYADAGDPYGGHWTKWLLLGIDMLAAGNLVLATQMPPGFSRNESLIITLGMVLLNRWIGIQSGAMQIQRRNAAVESGFDLSRLPEPAS
jgi:hypothetical protein